MRPRASRVFNLAMHTVGGSVSPGRELMQIVPIGDDLIIEAKLAPGNTDLVAGLAAEVLIQTQAASALSYLVKPLRDQIARAMREE